MSDFRFEVLVLDDDEDDTFLICEAISEIVGTNYNVKTAHTPELAMQAIRQGSFHAVLCDYRLGATSGIDFINDVRAQGYDMPIILLTGMENSSTDKQALEAGAADFLNKSNLSALVVDRAIRYAIANAERQRLLSAVLTSVDAAVCVLSSAHAPLLWNPSFAELARVQGNGSDEEAIHAFANRLQTSEPIHTVGARILEKKFSNLPDEGSVITLHDVTEHVEALKERERAENRAAHLAKHCSLTSLPNRIAFADRVEAEIGVSDQTNTEFFLLNLDLNKFKEINDVYGHKVGDQLLIDVSNRFISCLGEHDYLARLGGDEFVALQRKSKNEDDVPNLARRLEKSVADAFEIDGFLVRTGVSIGVSCYPQHGST
ncbi:MAG: diguanylate cyclase, partial [Pseudomonadota bacterium]